MDDFEKLETDARILELVISGLYALPAPSIAPELASIAKSAPEGEG